VSAAEAGEGAPDAGRVPLRVIVADDQRVVREGLTLMLGLIDGIEPVGAAADGEEALAMVAAERPDVVLMDLRMPRLDGIEATRRLAETHPGIGVVALTTYADDETIVAALQAGARGYLTKDAGAEQIRGAVERVAAGEAAIDPAVQRQLIAAVQRGDTAAPPCPDGDELPDGLTPREAEVLELIAAGLSNGEIADRLVVSGATVKSHVNHLFAKIGARDRAQAVAYAYQHELVADEGSEPDVLEDWAARFDAEPAHRVPGRAAALGRASRVEDLEAVLLFVQRHVAVTEDDRVGVREAAAHPR
jgi:DNA-binding NarL/FixJ family response regulator